MDETEVCDSKVRAILLGEKGDSPLDALRRGVRYLEEHPSDIDCVWDIVWRNAKEENNVLIIYIWEGTPYD